MNFKAHKTYFDDPMVAVEFPPNYYRTFIHPTNMKCRLKIDLANWNCTISLLCVPVMAKNGFGFQNITFLAVWHSIVLNYILDKVA